MSTSGPANAKYFSAKKLLSECETESLINRALCNGYLAGANDAHELHTELDEGAFVFLRALASNGYAKPSSNLRMTIHKTHIWLLRVW